MKKENYIVLIPARKNSKRLKNKNKKLLLNKPLISHSIEYALNYFSNDQIWVNSDDHELKDIAKKYNINFYDRKKELAEDETTTNLVVRDFCQNLINQKFKNIITLDVFVRFYNFLGDKCSLSRIQISYEVHLHSSMNFFQTFHIAQLNQSLSILILLD